jgi:hypothetical protein
LKLCENFFFCSYKICFDEFQLAGPRIGRAYEGGRLSAAHCQTSKPFFTYKEYTKFILNNPYYPVIPTLPSVTLQRSSKKTGSIGTDRLRSKLEDFGSYFVHESP